MGYSVHSAEAATHPFFSSRSSSSSGSFHGASPHGGGPGGAAPAHVRSHSMGSTGGTGCAGASPRGASAAGAADTGAAVSCPSAKPKSALDLHVCPPPPARPSGDARNGSLGARSSPRGTGAPGGGKGLGEGGEAAPAPAGAAQEAVCGGGGAAGDVGGDVRLITCTADATLRKARLITVLCDSACCSRH